MGAGNCQVRHATDATRGHCARPRPRVYSRRISRKEGGAISSPPRYRALAATLRARFQRAEYPWGEPLPSQPRLAREFGVSLATLRQALDVLRDEGWISSTQGGATRVTPPTPRRALVVE